MAEEQKPNGIVVYTDGSARPNPGFYGSGLHGYTYRFLTETGKPTKIGPLTATSKGYVVTNDLGNQAYLDAKPVEILSYLDISKSYLDEGTNNIAEIKALSMFFDTYERLLDDIDYFHVMADSKYVIEGLTKWVSGWRRNNWITSTGKPVSNQQEWEVVSTKIDQLKETKEFSIEWVRGHNDDFGNTRADYLAGVATNKSRAGLMETMAQQSPALGYHKKDDTVHPFLNLKRVYFNTDASYNTKGLYYQAGWIGPDYTLGKRTPECAFSVVRLAGHDFALESVISAQTKVPGEMNRLVYVSLDRLRASAVLPYIQTHGEYCFTPDNRNAGINFLDWKPMTLEVKPGELPNRAVDTLNHIEEILNAFLEANEHGKTEFKQGGLAFRVHDITDHFYLKGKKKVGKTEVDTLELKKEFVVGIKKTEIIVEELHDGEPKKLTLPLLFAEDIPGRNSFKRLETLHPEVYFVTWRESERALRYATVIKADDAVGIWSNYFANQVLF